MTIPSLDFVSADVDLSPEPAWHLFLVRHPQGDLMQQRLADAGVGTLIYYPVPPRLSAAYADLRPPVSDPWRPRVAASLDQTVLSLPTGSHMTIEQARTVTKMLQPVA